MTKMSPARRDGSEEGPGREEEGRSARAQRGTIGWVSLAMINLAIIYSVRGLPLMAEEGFRAISFMAISAAFFLIPISLVTAELSSTWPPRGDGGVYIWVNEALGQRWAFLAIWLQWSENVIWFPTVLSFIAATLAYAFSPELANNKVYTLIMVLVVYWGGTFANLHGMKTSAWISTLGVISTLIITGLIVYLGFSWILGCNASQIHFSVASFIPDFTHMDNLVFLAGALVIVSGIEVSAAHGSQVKDPKRSFPRAIFLSVSVSIAAIILGSLAIAFVVPQKEISLVAGLMEAFDKFFAAHHLHWLVPIVALLVVVGSLGEVAAWILGPSKGLLVSAQHGLLPPILQRRIHGDVPVNILILQALVVTGLVLVFLLMPTVSSAYWILTALTAQLYLIMYLLMFLSALVLRYKRPRVHRPYRIPWGNFGMWLVAALGLSGGLFTLFIGFFPPSQLETGNLLFYESFLILGILVMCGAAFVIYGLRKPGWAKAASFQEGINIQHRGARSWRQAKPGALG
ncbi:MAG: amino acid permease [Deltaproteobacteria bacterium]|nr:amino acid permease [Deltaproteobacteria bacterium]